MPLVIGKDAGTLEKVKQIDNYYGFQNGITGKDLFLEGIKQAEKLDIEIVSDEVTNIIYDGNFTVVTRNFEYKSKTIVLATGSSRKAPKIKGIRELEGKGVSYCAVCDAFFYRNKNVAVLGEGDYALAEAEHLLPIAKKVTLITDGKEAVQNRSFEIDINEKKIKEVRGIESVDSVIFEDETTLETDGVFIAIGTASSTDLARKLGAVIKENNVEVDDNMMTNVPGLFAAGDCTGGILQISKAIYEGTKAGLSIKKYLDKK